MRQLGTLSQFVMVASALLIGCSPELADTMTTGAPVLNLVTPAMGPNEGGLDIALDGQYFAEGALVTVDGTPASYVTVASPTHIIATLPARPGKWGEAEIVIKNPDGRSTKRGGKWAAETVRKVLARAGVP